MPLARTWWSDTIFTDESFTHGGLRLSLARDFFADGASICRSTTSLRESFLYFEINLSLNVGDLLPFLDSPKCNRDEKVDQQRDDKDADKARPTSCHFAAFSWAFSCFEAAV